MKTVHANKWKEFRFDVELHMVHKNDEGNITVVAILYRYGRHDPFLDKVSISRWWIFAYYFTTSEMHVLHKMLFTN